jgi:uncharacterized membrane protein YdjX (TVP38/TMEM64 family)
VNHVADRRRAVARLVALALLVALAFVGLTLAGVTPGSVRHWVADAGPLGPVLFVLAAGALGVALFPGHVTAAAAGVLFGIVGGTAVTLAVTLIGAALSFVVARRVGAEALLTLLGPRGRLRRDWVRENGFNAVLASRLAPGVPAGMVNYLSGLAGLRARAFLAAVALGAVPKTIAYVALGGALSDPVSARGAVAVGLDLAAAAGGALVARRLLRARRAAIPA